MRARRVWATALIAVALLWAGMVLGVAFVAVPAQFEASIARPVGIDIARHVFASLGRVELAAAAATIVLALLLRPGRLLWGLLVLVWLIVALETIWLLPVLDARADQVLQGEEPPPGPWHGLFAVSEVAKLGALLALACVAARRARGS